MKLEFYPKAGNDPITGYVAILPDGYSSSKSYPVMMIVHGMGERNDGSLSALKYLVEKQSWGGYIIPLEAQQSTDLYDIIVLVPNYQGDFNPDKVNWVFDDAIKRYSINQSKLGLTGFSLGGGAVLRYISSTQSNADRLAVAIPVAPVAWYTITDFVKNSSLPVWFHVNTNDTNGPTNLSVTLQELKEINSTSPSIPAIYTAYNKTGHGGQENAWGLNPPKAPDGKGFIDAKVNIYEWLLMNTNKEHKAVPSGTSSTITTSTTKSPGSIQAVLPAGPIYVDSPNIKLDASKSFGGTIYRWETIAVPAGENIYNLMKSGGWVTTDITLRTEGTYTFKFTISDGTNSSSATISVVYRKVSSTTTSTTTLRVKKVLSRTDVPAIGKTIVIYDDGSIEYEALS